MYYFRTKLLTFNCANELQSYKSWIVYVRAMVGTVSLGPQETQTNSVLVLFMLYYF